ncbi:MAG TPA: potassium channel family protein [Ruminiclostridium sp.]|nr:potassium channel family protein [Ruminiclostridium sp.]
MAKKYFFKVWDIAIIILSFYTVMEFFIELVTKIPEHALGVLEEIDFFICILFLADWIYYFIVSKDKARYFKHHLLDLISSIPFVQILKPLRIARAARIFRLVRLIRGMRGAEKFIGIFAKNKARSAMSIYIVITTIIYLYGTLGIYNFEEGINKNINSFGDAMWMAFTTLTTVGYGDCYPITPGGRILCALLVLTGMGLFSLFTAEFAAYILKAVNKFKRE